MMNINLVRKTLFKTGNFLLFVEVLPLKSLDEVKTRTMDMTMDNLALLANYLGYGWAGGCRGRRAGEDFLRDGDSWRSHYQNGCGGYMATHRLKIVYENFSFRVKNMEYKKPEIESIKPIVQDVGEIKESGLFANDNKH